MSNFKTERCHGLTDQEIIQMSLTDLEYFACLVLKYEVRLLNYIKKISQSNHDEAEDILQEAFIKIWKNLHGYDPRLTLESWIFRIVHNETISFWRKKTSYSKDKVVSIDDDRIMNSLSAENINHDDVDSVSRLIEDILPLLKLEYREVLVLKFLEDKSYEEISDILKIPEGTVATRINRAKKSFRELASGKFDNSIFK
ncbi:MAG: RNA polymerase sigma factor [Saprospiraceae bacterium]|jgi:RNA polymerase sigma-70 factor (ECF subfamily)|nr:RNA polymerase sigma factor [Saprospiraceae bacterium]MBK9566586.1 RNA polymerase sigma factor [Saprospiraceae bacterium]MBP6446323.1 RNA polymerase sigma factor [Saprospiraceae bacterium]